MRNFTVFPFVIFTLISCQETSKHPSNIIPTKIVENRSKKINQRVPEILLTLRAEPKAEGASIQDNLFGKFFCDRAEFYIIENPQNEIHSTKVKSITLYYLDGELKKTRYILEDDITNSLLKYFSNSKISEFNLKNLEVIKPKNFLITTENGITLNDSLTNYELKWTLEEKEIKYRVNTSSKYNKFTYLEETKDYKKELKEIERYCI